MQKLRQFLHDVKAELKKVVFPSKDELVGSTWVVIVSVVAIAIFLGAVDVVLGKVVQALLR